MGGGHSKFGWTYGSKKYKELKAQAKAQATAQSGTSGRSRSPRFQDFGAGHTALMASSDFFSKYSNSDTWNHGGLTGDEYDSIKWYTGNGYTSINKALYTTKYEDMPKSMQKTIDDMEKGLSKFELDKGIQVTRQSDFKIFGAKSGQSMTIQQIKDFIKNNSKNGLLQNDGFLSFGANNHGAAIDGSGLVIHMKVPPSIGAGAYVNPISMHSSASENEFLFNSKSLFKFDLNSIYKDSSGRIHISGVWKGRRRKQSFV